MIERRVLSDAAWFKSSYSATQDACVEVAMIPGQPAKFLRGKPYQPERHIFIQLPEQLGTPAFSALTPALSVVPSDHAQAWTATAFFRLTVSTASGRI
ncbi:DUF397 domain-containing protein [Saccharopolyspora pogona]|uniref:DUF397 domain-containing protein n=1 Tax=Saccharopolyspora pogona TaxID=333966 RepID=UPI0016885D93|nr:DUF397 domain-containing protein [Saccharopolyspora pogona]